MITLFTGKKKTKNCQTRTWVRKVILSFKNINFASRKIMRKGELIPVKVREIYDFMVLFVLLCYLVIFFFPQLLV